MAHKWQLTPPSSAPLHVTELHGPVLTLCPALPSAMQPAASAGKRTRSSAGLAAAASSCSASRWAGAGRRKPPPALRPAAPNAWVQRWSGIISVAAQGALAASLLELPGEAHVSAAGPEPALHELLAGARWLEGPAVSRMPQRG